MALQDLSIPNSPAEWESLQHANLPGYDPYATAGESYRFDDVAATSAVGFFGCLKFIEGEKAGQPFELERWQQAIIGALFGWKHVDTGLRRYREAFLFVPRKNGKTPLCAGMVLLGLFVDGEPGAQIYSAAAEREQAALVYRHASGMIARDDQLSSIAKVYKTFKSIEVPATNTVYKALSADADTKHGFSTHLAIIDELHAHPNGELVDVLQTSMGARREPLMVHITTADYDRPSVCNRKYDYATKVRDGVFGDSSFLPVIYEAKPDDDWTMPKTWAKANPNLGVSVRTEYLERECQRAQNEPTYENTFKRLHLNIRTQQDVRWLSLEKWDKCSGEPIAQGPCFGGLDLGINNDITALVLYFPETQSLIPWFCIPEDVARDRERQHRVPYLTWANQGLLELTPGDARDDRFVRQRVRDAFGNYDIQEVRFDRYNAKSLCHNQLYDEDGFPMVEHGQGYVSMNEATKLFEREVLRGGLRHGGNPILRWMSGNVAVRMDPAGNIKPDKARSSEKIDGIVAAIMAVYASQLPSGDGSFTSAYGDNWKSSGVSSTSAYSSCEVDNA